jgi:nucleotide-binding universal stress UspA family protein
MKILATFDGSALSESIIPQLETLSALPGAELVLLRVGDVPHGQTLTEKGTPAVGAPAGVGAGRIIVNLPVTGFAETKDQAVERINAELDDYLSTIAARFPGVPCRIESILDDHPRSAIVRFAITEHPDMIVMATHGHTGLVHVLFGDVAESVVRSGVAPVLLVHPDKVRESRTT